MVLVEGLLLVGQPVVVLPGLGDLRFVTMCDDVCGDGRVDGVEVDFFDATGRSDGAWAAPDAIDATAGRRRRTLDTRRKKGDAARQTMIIAASGSDMADSFVSSCNTPSKFPESLISSDVTGNNLAVSSPR